MLRRRNMYVSLTCSFKYLNQLQITNSWHWSCISAAQPTQSRRGITVFAVLLQSPQQRHLSLKFLCCQHDKSRLAINHDADVLSLCRADSCQSCGLNGEQHYRNLHSNFPLHPTSDPLYEIHLHLFSFCFISKYFNPVSAVKHTQDWFTWKCFQRSGLVQFTSDYLNPHPDVDQGIRC